MVIPKQITGVHIEVAKVLVKEKAILTPSPKFFIGSEQYSLKTHRLKL